MSSDWRSYRLDEVGRIVTGKTPKGNVAEYVGTDVPFVTPPDFDGSKWIDETARRVSTAGALSVKNNIVPAGSVLVTCIGSDMGKAALTASACVTNQQINAVVVDQEKFCPEFLYYNLSLRKGEIRGLAGGSAQPILNKTAFGQVSFDCPPLAQQKAISAAFGPLDDRITLLRETNSTLEAIAQALFKSWFVDFDPVRAKAEGRQPEDMDASTAALFPDSFEESELGLVPKGWQVGTIGNLAKITGGFAFKSNDFCEFGVPVIKIKNIVGDGTIDLVSAQCVDHAQAGKAKKFSLQDGDILMAMTGATIGKVGVVVSEGIPPLLNQRVAKFEPRILGQNNGWLIYTAFKNSFMVGQIINAASGSAQANISTTGIESAKLILPIDIGVLKAFEEIVSVIFSGWIENLKLAQTLTQLRDTLLPRLISGQLRLPEAMAEITKSTAQELQHAN